MAYPLRYKAEIADEIIRRMSEGDNAPFFAEDGCISLV